VNAPAPVIRIEQVGSTMDALHQLAGQGAPAGTVVVAAEQRAGRGSRGRAWSSGRGGLWLSVLARPAVLAGLELVSLRAGLGVAELLARLGAGSRIGLKWPNDLMLDDRKVGGILCETRWQGPALAWLVIGCGLNVTNRPPDSLAEVATNLQSVLPDATAETLLEPVVGVLRAIDAAGGELTDGELARFQACDWLRGRTLAAPAAGLAAGIGPDGSLLVDGPDGRVTVRSGSVTLAGSPATA
jgi:BirA family biotin operon repressor/biotin-[acetyl-CoA-carboxylase] ligase